MSHKGLVAAAATTAVAARLAIPTAEGLEPEWLKAVQRSLGTRREWSPTASAQAPIANGWLAKAKKRFTERLKWLLSYG